MDAGGLQVRTGFVRCVPPFLPLSFPSSRLHLHLHLLRGRGPLGPSLHPRSSALVLVLVRPAPRSPSLSLSSASATSSTTMFASRPLRALLLASLAASALGATYTQSDSHQGNGFLKSFQHEAIADPTHGRV